MLDDHSNIVGQEIQINFNKERLRKFSDMRLVEGSWQIQIGKRKKE
jgi:hypothetical protein